jgi:hypothetical protein
MDSLGSCPVAGYVALIHDFVEVSMPYTPARTLFLSRIKRS